MIAPTLPERIDGVHALIVTPFVLACLIAGAVFIAWVAGRERAEKPNPLMESWERDGRKPGELRRAER